MEKSNQVYALLQNKTHSKMIHTFQSTFCADLIRYHVDHLDKSTHDCFYVYPANNPKMVRHLDMLRHVEMVRHLDMLRHVEMV